MGERGWVKGEKRKGNGESPIINKKRGFAEIRQTLFSYYSVVLLNTCTCYGEDHAIATDANLSVVDELNRFVADDVLAHSC